MRKTLLPLLMLMIFSTTAAQESGVALIFWHHYPDERGDAIEALIEEYNAEITVQHFPSYDQQHEAILNALVNGGVPHIALVKNYDAALYQLSDALLPLPFELADINELIRTQDVYLGERLGLPMGVAYEALYINMDALRETGYDHPPTTRAEFEDMACTFDGWAGYDQFDAIGYDMPLSASFYLAMLYPFDVFDGETFYFDAPEVNFLLRDMRVQVASHCAAFQVLTAVDMQNRFASGKSLFYVAPSYSRSYVEAAIGSYFALPFELAVVPLPSQDGAVMNIYGTSLSIFKHDDAQDEAALNLLEWLSQPEQLARWADGTDTLPITTEPDVIWMREPNLAGYDLIWDEVVFAVRDVLQGANLEDRLRQLDAIAEEIFAAFGG